MDSRKNALSYLKTISKWYTTRLGPNRVAADMEGNGEFDFFLCFIRVFGEILAEVNS